MTVADRWIYFPVVGLIGIVGTGAQLIIQKKEKVIIASTERNGNKKFVKLKEAKFKKTATIICVGIIIVYSIRTIVRTTNYYNYTTLLTHDGRIQDNYFMEDAFGQECLLKKQYDCAIDHFNKANAFKPTEENFNNIARIYTIKNNIPLAENYYYKARKYHNKLLFNTDGNLAMLLLIYNSPEEASSFIKESLHDYPDSGSLWADLAIAEYNMRNRKEALNAAAKAKTIFATPLANLLYSKILTGQNFNGNQFMPLLVVHESNNEEFSID